MMVSENLV